MKILLGLVFTCFLSFAQGQVAIEGSIKDEASRPVQGGIVRLLNTGFSTKTDPDGSFVIHNVPSGRYTLYVSAQGYEDKYTTALVQQGASSFELVLKKTHTLETVVVSSQKREEIIQQLPLSITAISAAKAEAYRLWHVSDLTAVSSNLYASHPGDNRNATSIRGVVNTSYEQAVVTYVDGVNQFNLDTYIPQLFDVERIEVLKGPQGTLYGRNAMGGVINIITKKPGNEVNGFAQASLGNYALQRYTAGIRLPLVKDKLFFGSAGLYERTNGFYTNEFNNSHYDKRSSVIGNHYLRFVPGAQWNITLNVKHVSSRNRGAFPLVFGADDAFSAPFRLNQNAVTRMIDNVLNSSLSVNRYGRHVQLSSQTAYQSNHRYYTDPIDADFSPLDAVSIINNYGDDWNKVKVFTQEVNLQSAAAKDDKFSWLIGSYFFYQDNPVKQTTRFGGQAQMTGAPDNNFSLINTSKAKSRGAAVYGNITFAFSDKLSLTAGLRYDHEKREQRISGEYQKDPDPAFAYRSDTSAAAGFSALSPKLTLSINPSNQQIFYLSYNRGFRAGGLTPLSSDPSQPPLYPFKPEYGNNTEAGWKQSLIDQKLFLNLAVFYSTINDVQVPTLVLPDAVTITRNTGKLVSKGVETELRASLSKSFSVDYSLGYTNAKYSRLKVSQSGAEADLEGKRQLFTPDVTSMLAAQYSQETGKNTALIIRGEWKYLGTHYFDLANTIRQSPYHLLNARIGLSYRKAELALWGRNLTNQRHIGYAYDFGAVHLGDPRSYGVTAGVKF
jgi:iron complex outermembrane receptor protein